MPRTAASPAHDRPNGSIATSKVRSRRCRSMAALRLAVGRCECRLPWSSTSPVVRSTAYLVRGTQPNSGRMMRSHGDVERVTRIQSRRFSAGRVHLGAGIGASTIGRPEQHRSCSPGLCCRIRTGSPGNSVVSAHFQRISMRRTGQARTVSAPQERHRDPSRSSHSAAVARNR